MIRLKLELMRKSIESRAIDSVYTSCLFYINDTFLSHGFVSSYYNKLSRLIFISGMKYEETIDKDIIRVYLYNMNDFDKYLDLWYLSYKRKYDYNRKKIEEFFNDDC